METGGGVEAVGARAGSGSPARRPPLTWEVHLALVELVHPLVHGFGHLVQLVARWGPEEAGIGVRGRVPGESGPGGPCWRFEWVAGAGFGAGSGPLPGGVAFGSESGSGVGGRPGGAEFETSPGLELGGGLGSRPGFEATLPGRGWGGGARVRVVGLGPGVSLISAGMARCSSFMVSWLQSVSREPDTGMSPTHQDLRFTWCR